MKRFIKVRCKICDSYYIKKCNIDIKDDMIQIREQKKLSESLNYGEVVFIKSINEYHYLKVRSSTCLTCCKKCARIYDRNKEQYKKSKKSIEDKESKLETFINR